MSHATAKVALALRLQQVASRCITVPRDYGSAHDEMLRETLILVRYLRSQNRTSIAMLSAVASLQLLRGNIARTKAMIAADPVVARDSDYFRDKIHSVKTSKEFVDDYRLFSYAMKAYGLSDMTYATSFIKKVVDGGLINPDSMANRLTDRRFRIFARAFNFGDSGPAATANPKLPKVTIDAYVQQTVEETAGQQNEGARLALYFERKQPSITNGMSILADKALYKFVQTAFNLPASFNGSVETAAANIESKLNVNDLRDPVKLEKLVQRFAIMWDLSHSTEVANQASSLVSPLNSSGGNAGLLSQVQKRYTSF